MLEGNLPDVDPVVPDDAALSGEDTSERFGRRDLAGRGDPTRPQTPAGSRRTRRGPGFIIARGLRQLWIPLVILAVIAAGGFTVSRLHGIFGSDKSISYGDTKAEETKPFNPKLVRYEVFGPPGTVADISYFDENGEPQSEDRATLPWSLEFPMTGAMGIGSIAAQGDSDSIGCRILLDGEVKDESFATHEVSTFISCRLKAA